MLNGCVYGHREEVIDGWHGQRMKRSHIDPPESDPYGCLWMFLMVLGL